jgi:predicted ABC-type ATPase
MAFSCFCPSQPHQRDTMSPASERPVVVVIAGPNGAGKTTAASRFLPAHGGLEFVNADIIAAELALGAVETVELEAGRRMLTRLAELRDARASFALETTLAARTFATFLRECRGLGYQIEVYYFWLQNPSLAISRVAVRVMQGGHHVPDDVIRRRYYRGLTNFLRLYRPLADHWLLGDNSGDALVVVARGGVDSATEVLDEERYALIQRVASPESERAE